MPKTSPKLLAYQRTYWFENKEKCQENARILEEKCRKEREDYLEYCAKETGMTVKQVKRLQNQGWAVKEILAGKRKYGVFYPETLIYI